MAQITVDTDRDSVDSIKKIISLLEHTIAEKGGHVVTNASPSYGGYSTPSSMPSSAPVTPSNPFSMFDDNQSTSSTTSTPTQSSSTQQGGDIFSVFNDTPPSTSPGSYGSHGGYGSDSSYTSSRSAEDLLSEVDREEDFNSLSEYESDEKEDEKDFFQLESY